MRVKANQFILALTLAGYGAVHADVTNKGSKMTNREKVLQLLESIRTGEPGPLSYIDPDKYIQHNLYEADGVAGFRASLRQLPKGSAKVKVARVFEDGDYVFTHTDYDFFGPKIGFDVFRFEKGLMVEHWDNFQETVSKTPAAIP